MFKWLRKKIRMGNRGVASIEFALVFPFLALVLVGLFDVSNLIFCNNKMNRTAQDISNVVTRGNLTKPQLDSILQASVLMAQPFDFTSSGNVIVTSVAKLSDNQPPQVMWQDSYPGGTGASQINLGSLPGDLVLNTGQTVIFTEVFFTYSPLIPGYVIQSNQTQVYALAAAVPRQGQMTSLPTS